MTTELSKYMGLPVRQAGCEIPNAAGGLQAAMKIDPQEYLQGTKLFIVLEVVVQKHRHEPIDETNPGGDQRLVHVLKATGATFVDEDLVRRHLDEQAARIIIAKEQESGQGRIDGAALDVDHYEGKHAPDRVEGCPSCDKEARLEKSEATKAAKAAKKLADAPE